MLGQIGEHTQQGAILLVLSSQPLLTAAGGHGIMPPLIIGQVLQDPVEWPDRRDPTGRPRTVRLFVRHLGDASWAPEAVDQTAA